MTVQEQVKQELSNGVCLFTYKKEDGTIRYAVGTTNSQYLENLVDGKAVLAAYKSKFAEMTAEEIERGHIKSAALYVEDLDATLKDLQAVREKKSKRAVNPDMLVYFDLQKNGFRQCRLEDIQEVYIP